MPDAGLTNLLPALPQDKKPDVDYSLYSEAKVQLNRIIDDWTPILDKTQRNRALRYQKGVNADALRAQGILREDETYNPLRIIDTNIRREQPQFINYLTQSRRSIIFAPFDQAKVDGLEKLEGDFTNKARYLGWETPWIRCIDGAQTHGWDSIELVFDPAYPGNFCFQHVGHENLIFALDSENILNQEAVLRREQLTPHQLQGLVESDGWNEAEITNLISKTKSTSLSNAEFSCEVFKLFFKKDGIIFVTHFSKLCNEYFYDPRPLFLGVRDITAAPVVESPGQPPDYPKVYEKTFPHTILQYIESEDPIITNLDGRAKFDEATQEAASAISSGMINGVLRASNFYASPKATNINQNPNAEPRVLDVVLKTGTIVDTPLDFWNLPWPDPAVLQILQAIVLQNSQEQSRPDFAAQNRKDSGKTATEIQAANKQSSELSSVQIILLSVFVREAYGAKAWRVYQNRVLQGKIVVDPSLMPLFGKYTPPAIDPNTGQSIVDPSTGQPLPPKLLGPQVYIIKSSGDVDVIQRAENLQRKMQAWPVIANTPIAMEFLKDILRSAFPEDAARYTEILDNAQMSQENQLKTMLGSVSNVLHKAVTGPDGNVKPEYADDKADLEQLAGNVQIVLGQPPKK